MIAYYSLDGFYVGALPEAAGVAVVHRDKVVIDADGAARKRGIGIGMPLAEAKTILGTEGRYVPWEEEPFRTRQRAWIDVATECTDALEPDNQHAAYLDFSGHPSPQDVAKRLAETMAERFGVVVRFGLARSRWLAREAAHRGDPELRALIDPAGYASTLPSTTLPLPPDVVKRFLMLGYPSIGEIAAIKDETLRVQFGEFAKPIRDFTRGRGPSEVKAIFPANAISERFRFDGATDSLEVLNAGLRELAVALGNKLRSLDASAKTVELFLEHEDDLPEARKRTFSKPIAGAAMLTSALTLLLDELPEYSIEAVRVRLPDIARARRVQLALDGQNSRTDQKRSLDAALANARTTFGDTSVVLAADVVDPRWKQVRRAYSIVNGWIWN